MTFRNGNVFLTHDGMGIWSNIPVLMVGRVGEAIKCLTGLHVILLEKEKLYPHGCVRKIKVYHSPGKNANEFAQFKVNFGEEEYTVDVRMSSSLYDIEDLRKAAFTQALQKRADQ